MATEMNVAVRLQADASQYTAEFTRAGTTAQDFGARVSGSSSAAAGSLQAVADSLTKVDASNAKASASSSKLASEYSGLSSSATAVAQAFTAAEQKVVDALRNEYVELGKNRTEIEKYRAAQMGLSSAAQSHVAAMATKIEAWHREEDAARAAANAQDQMAAQQASFVASLKAQTDTLGMSRRQLLEYQAAQLGVADKASPLIQKLYGTEEAFNRNGMSAKATAAAMRGVPAQMTDIVTSLQGGQAPLTVFLQQGGQLKDMFGGAGNAARALGGYVVGLVNPFTVAAAAAGVLAVAYYQGSKEAENYNKALILSGGIAGTTASQMADMARQLGQGDYTQGKAAAVIAELAQSGAVAGDQLQKMAATAIDVERATGQAIGKTAEVFKDLAKEPLAASLKLNESLHYLTLSTYEHIKSLEEQGKKTEAGRVAMDAYANTMANRAKQITENNGFLETSWRGVGRAAGWAWDQMVGIGRAATGSEQLAGLKKTLADREARGPLNTAPGMSESYEKGNKALREQIAQIERLNSAQQQTAKTQAEQGKAVAAKAVWDKEVDQFATNAQKRSKEINKAQLDGQALIKAGLLTEVELRTQIAHINEKYKDKKGPAGSAGSAGTGQTEVAGMQAKLKEQQAYLARLKEQSAHPDRLNDAAKLSDGEKQVIKLNEELKTSITGVARAQKEKALETAVELAAVDQLVAGEEKRIKGLKESQASHDKLIDANFKSADSIEEQAAKQDAANAVFGKGKTAIEQMTLATLKNQLQEAEGSDAFDPKYIASLNAKIAAQMHWVKSLQGSDYAALMQKEQDWLDQAKERAALYEDEKKLSGLTNLERAKIVATRQIELKLAKELAAINQRDLSDAQKHELSLKAREAAAIDSSAAVNKVIQDDATQSANHIQQSLTDALMRGGKSGADYLKDLFRTMVLRPTINALMAPVSGVINGAVNAGMSAIGLGGGGGGGGGGGMLGGVSNLSSASTLYSAGSYFASGLTGSMTGAAAGMGATLPGASVGIGAMAGGSGASGLLGSAGSALGAMGPVGWTALAGLAIAAVVSAQKGDTRFGSSYRYDADNDSRINGQRYVNGGQVYSTNGTLGSPDEQGVRIVGGPNGGVDFNGMSKAQAGVIDSINATYKRLESKTTLAAFQSGFESSEKGKAFAYAGGVTSEGGVFGQGATGNGHLNRRGSMTTEQAAAGYASELKQATLQALQSATDIPKSIRNALAGIDIDALSDQALDQLSGAIGKQITDTDALRTALLAMPFESLKHLSFDAAAGLIAASGGLEQLSANLNAYQENFFTEEEKRATKVKNITKIINDAGGNVSESAVSTATRAQARAYIESVDVTTQQGQKLKAALLSVAGALASITDAATVAGSELASAVSSAMGDLDKASERAAADRISAYRSEASALQSTMDKHLAYADQLKKFRDGLLLGSQSPLTPAQRYAEASKQFDAAQASGDAAALQSASSAFLEASKVYNASNSTYTSDFAAVQQALTKAAISSSASADVARLQLNAVNSQLSSLQQIDRGVMSVGQAMERLSAAVMASVNAGLNPGVASIARLTNGVQNQQVGNYYSSSAGAGAAWGQNGLQIYTPGGQQFSGADAINRGNELAAAGDYRRIYDEAKGAGISMVAANQLMGWSPGTAENWAKANGLPTFAKGGIHDGGWAMVGERGPEMAYMPPARIYNASETNRFMSGSPAQGMGTHELEAKVDALLQEIQGLRKQQREETGALISSNYDANSKNADALAQSRDRARWSKREPELT